MDNTNTTTSRRQFQRRSAVACTLCHARKVRCNVSLSGSPCANCERDRTECVLHSSGRGKYKRRSTKTVDVSSVHVQSVTATDVGERRLENLSTPNEDVHVHEPPLPFQHVLQSPPASHSSPFSSLATTTKDDGENSDAWVSIVESPMAHGSTLVPLFSDDSICLRFIFNVLEEDVHASKSHYLVPKARTQSLAQEDLDFLNAKGSFLLPPEELLEQLIQSYFNYVHPLLPVVEPTIFFSQYRANGSLGVSLLLIQSMLFAASNFVDPELLSRSGFSSTKALKRKLYQRVKALYDLDYEKDKVALIQAVLLMSYWFNDTHDRADSWHWVGVAISLAQTIGLHRSPSSSNVPTSQQRLWKRVWWCCFHRDRWIALGMGRPTRINNADCNVSILTVEDLVDTSPPSNLSEASKVVVASCDSYATFFVEAVKLSSHLGNILTLQYGVDRLQHSEGRIQHCDDALSSWYNNLGPDVKVDLASPITRELPVRSLHQHMLQILFQVVVITLYRPEMFEQPPQRGTVSQDLRTRARCKATFAASTGTELLKRVIDLDLIKYLPPLSVTAISPIIGVHFVEKTWTTGLLRQVANQKLELTLMILQELSDTYWAATFLLKYYRAAFNTIESALSSGEKQLGSTSNTGTEKDMDVNIPICEYDVPFVLGDSVFDCVPNYLSYNDFFERSSSDFEAADQSLSSCGGVW